MSQPKISIIQEAMPRIAAFDHLPDDALLNVREVSALACRSVPSVWRDAKAGVLAQPVKVGVKATRWRVVDVRNYLAGGKR